MTFYMILIGPASECGQVRDRVFGKRTKRVECSQDTFSGFKSSVSNDLKLH